jgi:hypothetical protein
MVWFLDLGDVHEVAEVTLNGVPLGIRSFASFSYEVTNLLQKENELQIEVVNLLNNRLVGEGRKPEGMRKTKSNITKLPTAWSLPMGEAPLKKSGLLGPVTLTAYQVYEP